MRGGKREGAGRPLGSCKAESLTKTVHVRMHPNLYQELKDVSCTKQKPLNTMIREICEDFLKCEELLKNER